MKTAILVGILLVLLTLEDVSAKIRIRIKIRLRIRFRAQVKINRAIASSKDARSAIPTLPCNFDVYDTHKDGMITPYEYTDVLKERNFEDGGLGLFRALDKDGDDVIMKKEFEATKFDVSKENPLVFPDCKQE